MLCFNVLPIFHARVDNVLVSVLEDEGDEKSPRRNGSIVTTIQDISFMRLSFPNGRGQNAQKLIIYFYCAKLVG